MVIMMIFLCLSAIFIVSTVIYLNKKKTNNHISKKEEQGKRYKEKQLKKQLKDILNIKVKNSIIYIENSNRYSCIIKLGSIDYNMLSDNEQETIENVLMQTAISLDSPIQFFSTTENIDTTMIIERIEKTKPINNQIRNYKERLITFLSNLMEDKNISLVKSYAIISYDGFYKDAIQELNRKTLSFKLNLLRAKIQCDILNDNEIYSLIYRELNKNSNITTLNIKEEGEKLYVNKKEQERK